MNYCSMVYSTSHNTTICKDTVTNIAFGQMPLRMKRDESRINRTLEAVRSHLRCSRYFWLLSERDTKAIVDEVGKKGF
jgi:hypothetical protein